MIRLPAITIIDDIDLFVAIDQLSLPEFKLFIYLVHLAGNYEEHGNGCEQAFEDVLCKFLKLDEQTVRQAFIGLRRNGWLDVLTVTCDDKAVCYTWRMYVKRPDGRPFCTITAESVEREQPYDKYNRETYLVIGDRVIPPKPKKKKTRREHTGAWLLIRKQVLERDCHQCTECGSGEDLHVHHLTYENEGHEKLEDLVTLCASCHGKVRNG